MNSKDVKKTWLGIKSILNIDKGRYSDVNQLNIDGKIIDDPTDIAQRLNDFFVNVGPNTDKSIPTNPVSKPEKYLKNRSQVEFIISHISNEEIIDIINSLENKAQGPQSIPLKLLKLIPDLIIFPLSEIINLSFSSGVFPNAIKIAKVIPIHKGGSTDELNNYRPISILSIFDKIIEKLIHKQLYHFLTINNVLFKNQYGFRKNNSTSLALIQMVEKIRESIDNKKIGCGIFIDLSKAFDTVNHKILLKKLEHYGIRGTALKWFQSYLFERKQYVYINGESSSLRIISCGVPQGSVLGPLLFLLYVNDLPNISDQLTFFLFADDTNIFYESQSLTDLERTLNKELRKLQEWLIVNRLSLNLKKTNFVLFHPFNKPLSDSITVKINKKAISEKNHVKYLGISLDSTLSWKSHIENLCSTLRRTVGMLYKIRSLANKSILVSIYYSLFYSYLNYGIEVWGNADKSLINRILTLQKRAIRAIMFRDQRQADFSLPPSRPLFKELKLLSINGIFKLRLVNFVHKCVNKLLPINFHSWFYHIHNIHNHNTRANSDMNLYIPRRYTTHYGLKSIKYNGAKLWNEVSSFIKLIKSNIIFVKTLKEQLILSS